MMKNISIWLFVMSSVLFSGCAHKIDISPKLDAIRAIKAEPYQVNVAYYLSDEDRKLEVTTPGGGGDKVKYTPYLDTEAALNTVLSNVFAKTYSLKTLEDNNFIAEKKISYILIPKITTTSSSGNAFTWPPEDFSVGIFCKVLNSADKSVLFEIKSTGNGTADFGDYRLDFSAAARKASEKAFLNFQNELLQNKDIIK